MSPAPESAHVFDDGAEYDRFMGRWSRAAGPLFLDWIAVAPNSRWLDVGCGTGILTQLIADRCRPARICAIDPAPAQVARAQQHQATATFQVADAVAVPYRDGTFDVVASALVMNFIADKARALDEMCRVARRGGTIAAFVWDFATERSPSGPMRRGLRAAGGEVPAVPGTRASSLAALQRLFEGAGLESIATRTIEVGIDFPDFESYWLSQLPRQNPITRTIEGLDRGERERMRDLVRAELAPRLDGSCRVQARANAIKARVPRS